MTVIYHDGYAHTEFGIHGQWVHCPTRNAPCTLPRKVAEAETSTTNDDKSTDSTSSAQTPPGTPPDASEKTSENSEGEPVGVLSMSTSTASSSASRENDMPPVPGAWPIECDDED